MANLLDWNTLEHKVKSYIDPDSEVHSLQKAFPILMVATILEVSDEEAEDAITDGPSDRGCDAIFIDDRDGKNTVHIFQFKYVNSFDKTKANFPSNEIDKLATLINDILDQDKKLKTNCNPLLWSKIKDIWAALDRPSPNVEVHFCSNTKKMVSTEQERAVSAFGKYKYFHVHHHGLDEAVGLLVSAKTVVINDKIQVVDKNYFDRTDGSVRGLICTVEALEVVRLITDPDHPDKVRPSVFNDNVRIYLSKNNKINRKIIETATSDNGPLFWYRNNGITITCDSFSYPSGKRAPFVELSNLQIVNGGQTSNALFEAKRQDNDCLADVLVLVRIIETKDQDISISIAESTNSQTAIKTRDLRSNDDTQKKLEEAFEAMGLFYERKTKQHSQEKRDLRIDALLAGQAHLSYGLDLPEVAKKDRGRIFSDLYEQVFSDEVTADHLLTAYRLLKQIEKRKRTLQSSIRKGETFSAKNLFLIDGAHHVLFAVGQLADKRGIDRLSLDIVSKLIPESVSCISKLVASEQASDEAFSFNRFFKDAKTKNKIARDLA
jgi:hypothetical protein